MKSTEEDRRLRCQYHSDDMVCPRCDPPRMLTDIDGSQAEAMKPPARMKSTEEHFVDWEAHVFGYGYGTGEPHTLHVLKAFLANVTSEGNYDYVVLEQCLDAEVAWLLINALCHADVIDYGVAPRYGWLTDQGKALKRFVDGRTDDELVKLVCERPDDYIGCYPDACNCGPEGYEAGRDCGNPFWKARAVGGER